MIVHDGRRHRITPFLAGGVILCLRLCLGLSLPGDCAAADPFDATDLSGGVKAAVDDGAVVRLWADADAKNRSLLVISPPWTATRRRAVVGDDPPVLRLTREGVENGRRGFSRRADDDGDGRVDEDRLDGRDNDDDGLIDEDFAAVGDEMHVVHAVVGGEARHLETYHWNYEHLSETVVIAWTRDAEDPADAVLTLGSGDWSEARIGWSTARAGADDPSGAAMAAARVIVDGREHWLGVSVLEGGAVLRMDEDELRLSVDRSVTIAVSSTATLTQLRHRQAVAHALHDGARSAPGTAPVPWIVPPPKRVTGRQKPSAVHGIDAEGATVLTVSSPEGWPFLPDPETFVVGDLLLGAPRRAAWEPTGDEGGYQGEWPRLMSDLRRDHPFLPFAESVKSGGQWTFTFPPLMLPDDPATMTMTTVEGRPVEVALSPAPEIQVFSTSVDESLEDDEDEEDTASLSPLLLDQYPNPFVDRLQLDFRIPETVGEGFVWDDDDEPLLAPGDPIPYTSPEPRVTLKIYNVAGHEIAAVFDETCGPGERSASWNGLDAAGRPVATGTYFCKLQIENWSVTKRVALIR
jgi:hypothetical protein